ncbi:MAG: LemA family protein [Elusimicrobia bacterium CG1_02_37_114]|nr:MAG: LemA family protein [Elusimicrobia bacterium CG1_02_37_114]PIV54039.1 MAG: LemA family protein [Elusimicrobia bacterium CG02_land_8_20_14_3_00_37_13]PIZ12467.1 MAG: LemA family protein [Elusimicrobia bacterium CG_4_10_14_0_8_um_filter_37_32]
MKKGWIVLGVVVVLVLIVFGTYVSNYNRLVTFNESIDAAWAQVENQLQRRFDLIPNLVNTAKGYIKHEKEVFTHIADARAKLAGARTTNEKVQATNEMESALSRLLVVVENYPQLRSNENFIRLQDELAGTENRIAVERRRYNETVQIYNILVKRLPSNIVAAMSGFKTRDIYFKVEEPAKKAPKVEF